MLRGIWVDDVTNVPERELVHCTGLCCPQDEGSRIAPSRMEHLLSFISSIHMRL